MIQIEDNDSPILAAYKIISGTKKVKMTPLKRFGMVLEVGKAPEVGELFDDDMYSDDEIREIAEHLQACLKRHGDPDEKEQADGCTGCAFESTEEWEMPCAKCRRACKDYWRANHEAK